MGELDKLLGGGGEGSFEEFSTLDNFNRTGFILGCENWDRYDLNEELGRHRATYIGKLTLPIIIFTISLGYKEEYNMLLSSDWRSYKLRLRLWVRGQWCKRYGSNVSILIQCPRCGTTSGYSCSCPLTGDLTSSACVCGCVVNGVSATAAT